MEWSSYRRVADPPVEAMRAYFYQHVYDRHSHDTYSFGVTEQGAQAFRCRGAHHTSHAGMLMTFNPDDPHDGHAGGPAGFTYRMLHLPPELVGDVLADAGGQGGLPLFTAPVVEDDALAARLRRVHALLLDGATRLEASELLSGTVLAVVRRHASRPPATLSGPGDAPRGVLARTAWGGPAGGAAPARVRELLHDRFAEDLGADDLARAVGLSRFQVSRLFREAYGVPPSAYLRQVRLREARRRLAAGEAIAAVAAAAGFADQSHLTRWFRRTYGITPAVYQRGSGGSRDRLAAAEPCPMPARPCGGHLPALPGATARGGQHATSHLGGEGWARRPGRPGRPMA
jgi:AraC-like DNA-binding protein